MARPTSSNRQSRSQPCRARETITFDPSGGDAIHPGSATPSEKGASTETVDLDERASGGGEGRETHLVNKTFDFPGP